MEKITLILGAGASLAMGYPLGMELRKKILTPELYREFLVNEDDENDMEVEDYELKTFIDSFRKSQLASIDAFLAQRTEFSDIGKKAIAAILLKSENSALLHDNENNDHWYFDFYQMLASGNSWEMLDLSHISVVTFNYDRSFEFYLMHALAETFNKRLLDSYRKVCEMKIIHMYGSVGTCDPSSSQYRDYGETVTRKIVNDAAKNIKVIPQSRNEDKSIIEARKLLDESDRIAFLGFGFDKLNLQRLDSENTCALVKGRQNDSQAFNKIRKIVGTTLGKTAAETLLINSRTAKIMQQDVNKRFLHCNCSQLIRETLILEQ